MKNININEIIFNENTKLFVSDENKIFFKKDKTIRLNPSIININQKYKLICFRVWIDRHFDKIKEYPKPFTYGSPHVSRWTPYLTNINKLSQDINNFVYNNDESSFNHIYKNERIKLNYIGLAVVEIIDEDIIVIHSQINEIYDYRYLEDFRLFIDSNNKVKLIGNLRFDNEIIKHINFKNNRIQRGIVTLEINYLDKIMDDVFLNEELKIHNLVILFPEFHLNIVEKNWVYFKNINNKDFITFFSFPNSSPIYNILLEDKNEILINDKIKINVSEQNQKLNIDFFSILNKYYYNCLRFSAGSCLIDYNENETIGVGHLVINFKKMKKLYSYNDIDIGYLMKKFNISRQGAITINLNILNIISRPERNAFIYDHRNKNKIYMMFFYTINKFYPYNILKISNAFTPQINQYNTSITFPCGICDHNDEYIISYGESDNICCLLFFDKNDIKLNNINEFNPSMFLFENLDLYNENKIVNRYK